MPKKGDNIYLRKDGRWEGRIRIGYAQDGRVRYRSIYGTSREDVAERLRLIREADVPLETSEHELTVNDVASGWMASCVTDVKVSTFERYNWLLNKHVLPELGRLPVRELTADRIERFLAKKRRTGRLDENGGLSAKTVNDLHAMLSTLVRFAGREFLLPKPVGLEDVRFSKRGKPRIEVFSERETNLITVAIMREKGLNELPFLICLETGLRVGEVCALRWEDVNFEENMLSVRRTAIRINYGGYTVLEVQKPKTENSERTIPLTSKLMLLLRLHVEGKQPGEYIFPGRNGGPLDPRSMQYRFQKFLIHQKISPRSFHTLRHSFATRCIERGVDVKTLSEILGHSNVQTTLQMYTHPSMERKRTSMENASTLK